MPSLRLPAVFALLVFMLGCNPEARIMATYMGTPPSVARAMLKLGNISSNDVVYDLGSGDGRIVIMAAKEFGARGVGVEFDPKLVALARENARKAGVADKVHFIEGDLFKVDLRPATAVTLYLHDTLNMRLRPKLLSELRPGTPVVSHEWKMGDWKPDVERAVDDTRIYLWRIPATSATGDKSKG